MPVYYNEHDPKAAAWLKELLKLGLIADGEIDTRSILDVRPADLAGFDQCHFFAGIGGWSFALRLAGWPDDRHVWTGSCPCQPFSAAGKGDGFADERHLWPAFYWLIAERAPHILFGEQVESPAGRAWLDLVSTDLEAADYAIGPSDLPAAGIGSPQIRQRLFWVADRESDRCRQGHQDSDGRRGITGVEGCAEREAQSGGQAQGSGQLHVRNAGAASGLDDRGITYMTPSGEQRLQRVQIVDREHPHFEEYGRFTGKVITMRFSGESMAEVKLEHCQHGVDGCFVSKGQVRQVGER